MTDGELSQQIAHAVERLSQASRACALTGAGISAESGIPTFRGPGGFFAGRRAEDLATPQAFARDPEDVWRFYLWRRGLLAEKKPNPGHFALADIERIVPRFTLITQNVDDLHRLAGSKNIVELHGNIWIDRCTHCGWHGRSRDVASPLVGGEHTKNAHLAKDDVAPPLVGGEHTNHANIDDEEQPPIDIPKCPTCGAMTRPGVVWFGETLPPDALRAAQRAATECDVMLVIGTSSLVQPAASLADCSRARGAFVIEINPEDTPLSPHVDLRFPLPSGQVLPKVAESLNRVSQ